jgi:hypothetical protein
MSHITQEQFEQLDNETRIKLISAGLVSAGAVNEATDEDLRVVVGLSDLEIAAIRGHTIEGDITRLEEPHKDADSPALDSTLPPPPPEPPARERRNKRARSVEPPVQARLIKSAEDFLLIEYADGEDLSRVVVALGDVELQDGGVVLANPEVLRQGAPYGLPWEDIIEIHITPADVARKLRQYGIWTLDDMLNLSRQAQSALQAALQVDVQAMRTAALAYAERAKEE